MVWVVVFGYSSHIHGESFTFLQQDTFLWACLGWRIEPSAPWRRFSPWLKLSQGFRLKLQSTVSDGNPSCLFWFVYKGCQIRYCTSTCSYWNVNSGLAESVLERRRDLKLSSGGFVALSNLKCWAAVCFSINWGGIFHASSYWMNKSGKSVY